MSAVNSKSENSNTQTFDECMKKITEEHFKIKKAVDDYEAEIRKLTSKNGALIGLIDWLFQGIQCYKMQRPMRDLSKIKAEMLENCEEEAVCKVKHVLDYVEKLREEIGCFETLASDQYSSLGKAKKRNRELEQKIKEQKEKQENMLGEKEAQFEAFKNLQQSTKEKENQLKEVNNNICAFQTSLKEQLESMTKQIIQTAENILESPCKDYEDVSLEDSENQPKICKKDVSTESKKKVGDKEEML